MVWTSIHIRSRHYSCLVWGQERFVCPCCLHTLQVGGALTLRPVEPSSPDSHDLPLPWAPRPRLPTPPPLRVVWGLTQLEGMLSTHSKKPHWSSLGLEHVKNILPLLGPSFWTVLCMASFPHVHITVWSPLSIAAPPAIAGRLPSQRSSLPPRALWPPLDLVPCPLVLCTESSDGCLTPLARLMEVLDP